MLAGFEKSRREKYFHFYFSQNRLIDDEVFPFGFFFIFTPIFIKIKTRFMDIVNLEDKNYPKLLKKIGKDAPKQFYCKGNYEEKIFTNCLAVVGSRQMT